MPNIRLGLCQTNPIVGDISGNVDEIFRRCKKAAESGVNLAVFGEMSITGYPVEDLVTRHGFVADAEVAVSELATRLANEKLGHMAVVVGAPSLASKVNGWAIAHNTAFVIHGGGIIAKYNKHHLPNYSVFDEYRNFVPDDEFVAFNFNEHKVALVICEDIWQNGGPVASISNNQVDLTLVLNGSPFEVDKDDRRQILVQNLATKQKTAVAYVNLFGGQDDLVFDGDSMFVDSSGTVIARASQFTEDLVMVDFNRGIATLASRHSQLKSSDGLWQVWNALSLGLRDYVQKNGFKSVVLGLSGGIDSAVVAAIATDAIGAENVYGISMPSRYSSDHSKSDAQILADNLGCHFETIPIRNMVSTFESDLPLTALASENIQARIRGMILMAQSNNSGHLVLTTGNKTELAVGYSTIYGDSVGGFAPIKDIEKTLVWKLAIWRNNQNAAKGLGELIPENSISKPPSAELRPDQTDQDSLPEYGVLDEILELYIGMRLGFDEIVSGGFDPEVVRRVIDLVDRAEWKRRQGAIGPKITSMAFGRDRRLPITNKYKG